MATRNATTITPRPPKKGAPPAAAVPLPCSREWPARRALCTARRGRPGVGLIAPKEGLTGAPERVLQAREAVAQRAAVRAEVGACSARAARLPDGGAECCAGQCEERERPCWDESVAVVVAGAVDSDHDERGEAADDGARREQQDSQGPHEVMIGLDRACLERRRCGGVSVDDAALIRSGALRTIALWRRTSWRVIVSSRSCCRRTCGSGCRRTIWRGL